MNKILAQAWMQEPELKKIFTALGGGARFVGGCVRDALLELPVKEIDIATIFDPIIVTQKLERAHITVIPTGIKFGTVTAIIPPQQYEITTLRRDIDCDGRHAVVEYTDNYEEDAARRDFTINAMSCDLEGNVYDYFDGLSDLKIGHIQFVGDPRSRCREDLLRILRFFRFYAYYGKAPMDPVALLACHEFAPDLDKLSGERILKEMLRLLESPDPCYVLEMMDKTSVLEELGLVGVKQTNHLQKQIQIEKNYTLPISGLLRLVQLINHSDEPRQNADFIVKRWAMSKKQQDFVTSLVAVSLPEPKNIIIQHQAIRQLGKEQYQALVRLHWAQQNDADDKFYLSLLEEANHWQIPEFPLLGRDLLERGFKPGQALGQLLKQAEAWWEANHYQPTQAMLIEYIYSLIKK